MCIASFKSMTYAIKAKKATLKSNIYCEIINLDEKMAKQGCAYGIKFNCNSLNDVERILTNSNITYSQIITDSKV